MVSRGSGPWVFRRADVDFTGSKYLDEIEILSFGEPIDMAVERQRVRDHARCNRALKLLKRAQQLGGTGRTKKLRSEASRAKRPPSSKAAKKAFPAKGAPGASDVDDVAKVAVEKAARG